ncbi:adhesion G-protein coupled receptor G6-like [Diadema antillarum]|uniref:adhesion G-protein coupled receptor G6-like n=1 Tax=Diadema antillarum TaxID=105358 RepID=UPI003A882E32
MRAIFYTCFLFAILEMDLSSSLQCLTNRCVKDAVYVGCSPVRCFDNAYQISSENMTGGSCYAACAQSGHTHFALHGGKYCFCACRKLCPTDDEVLPDDQCGVPCAGSVSMFCGGLQTVQIYYVLPDCDIMSCSCETSAKMPGQTHQYTSEQLSNIEQIPVTTSNVDRVLSTVKALTGNGVDSQALTSASNILKKVTEQQYDELETPEITKTVVEVISNLLNSEPEELTTSQVETGAGSKVMKSLEAQLERIELTEEPFTVIKPNVAVQVQSIPTDSLKNGLTFVSSGEGVVNDVNVYQTAKVVKSQAKSSVSVRSTSGRPDVDPGSATELRISFAVINNPALLSPAGDDDDDDDDKDSIDSSGDGDFRPNSQVLSVTLFGLNQSSHLPLEVMSVFKPLQVSDEQTTISEPICVFWDFNAENGLGAWSEDGCWLVSFTTDNLVRCRCNHTTNFAILMNFKEVEMSNHTENVLEILSYSGCALSIASLLLTIVTYSFSKKLRQKQPNQILICLAVSLTCLYVTFIIVATLFSRPKDAEISKGPSIGCYVVAGLMHYFTLASLTWMGVEGVHLYLLFVRVVNFQIPGFMPKAISVAWGIPVLVVVTTGAVSREDYVHEDVCFLDKWPKIASLVIPGGVILLVNCIIFAAVLVRLRRNEIAKKARQGNNTQGLVRRLQNAICLLLLLGLPWSIGGFLFISKSNVFFQMLFIALNSFQGFFIFVFHCLRQPAVREELIGCCGSCVPVYQPATTRTPKAQQTATSNDAAGGISSKVKEPEPTTIATIDNSEPPIVQYETIDDQIPTKKVRRKTGTLKKKGFSYFW